MDEAEKLITSGFKHWSAFGRWCPVSWQDVATCRLPVQPVNKPLRRSRVNPIAIENLPVSASLDQGFAKKVTTCAATYRENVYWFQTPSHRKQFMLDPIAYLQNKKPPLVHQPLQICIVGAPKSGKTQRMLTTYNTVLSFQATPSKVSNLYLSLLHELVLNPCHNLNEISTAL